DGETRGRASLRRSLLRTEVGDCKACPSCFSWRAAKYFRERGEQEAEQERRASLKGRQSFGAIGARGLLGGIEYGCRPDCQNTATSQWKYHRLSNGVDRAVSGDAMIHVLGWREQKGRLDEKGEDEYTRFVSGAT